MKILVDGIPKELGGIGTLLLNVFDYNIQVGNDKNYQFNDIIDEVCSGSWQKRVDSYKKYFLIAPDFLLNNISELDELRQKRNMVGHYFGRTKQQYEIPILLQPQPAIRVSHEKLLKYWFIKLLKA